MVRIRTMTAQDLDAVMQLESSIPEAPHWTRAVYERFASSEPNKKRIFIAEEGERLLGFIAAQIILDVCELDSIVVDVTARRSGVGRALLAALVDWVTSQSVIRVQLEVRSSNIRSIRFYLDNGFVRDGLRPAYYRNPEEDAVLMSKSLE